MSIYEELRAKVMASGVRVEQRLELLRVMQEFDGGAQLSRRVDEHEAAIERAAKKLREVLR